jgi:phage terminase large subunit
LQKKENASDWTERDQDEWDWLQEQELLEFIHKPFDQWKKPFRYKIAYGGRGAGAKSWTTVNLLVQIADKQTRKVLCVREVQKSIEHSIKGLIEATIKRLRYPGWRITDKYIKNMKNGSIFIFNGLNDMSSEDLKSYESFDILFAEEAAPISYQSWRTILPTFRKKGSEIWALFNRDKEIDPVYDIFVMHERKNSCVLALRPGPIDNPYWFEGTLQAEMEESYKFDPDDAAHEWEGLPRNQNTNSIIKRTAIREAMIRDIKDPEGAEEAGVDVARFGDDSTEMFRRKGMKIVKHKTMKKANTGEVARAVWAFIDMRKDILIKIDEGYNPGVIDVLKELGASVIPISFGGKANDSDHYANIVSEMWFTFPIDEVDIPDDPDLMNQLADRRYKFDKASRKMVESKDDYKKRAKGKSPDAGDALLLTYYNGKNTLFSDDIRKQMRELRKGSR